jgi:hypothetical protein
MPAHYRALEIAQHPQIDDDASLMPERSIEERLSDCEKIQNFQKAELTEHARRLGELEVDLKALIQIVDSIGISGMSGEDGIRALLRGLLDKYEISPP